MVSLGQALPSPAKRRAPSTTLMAVRLKESCPVEKSASVEKRVERKVSSCRVRNSGSSRRDIAESGEIVEF